MKTKTKPSESKAVKAINRQFAKVCAELLRYQVVCRNSGTPVRVVTFRVLDNGETRCHVTSRRVKK